jgi:ArsR family transcriptional regulator
MPAMAEKICLPPALLFWKRGANLTLRVDTGESIPPQSGSCMRIESMAVKQEELDAEQVQAIAKALGDPRRYEILTRLGQQSAGLQCSSVLGCIGVSAATLSHHMKELEAAGLVKVERQGKFAHYQLRREVLRAFYARLRKDMA